MSLYNCFGWGFYRGKRGLKVKRVCIIFFKSVAMAIDRPVKAHFLSGLEGGWMKRVHIRVILSNSPKIIDLQVITPTYCDQRKRKYSQNLNATLEWVLTNESAKWNDTASTRSWISFQRPHTGIVGSLLLGGRKEMNVYFIHHCTFNTVHVECKQTFNAKNWSKRINRLPFPNAGNVKLVVKVLRLRIVKWVKVVKKTNL